MAKKTRSSKSSKTKTEDAKAVEKVVEAAVEDAETGDDAVRAPEEIAADDAEVVTETPAEEQDAPAEGVVEDVALTTEEAVEATVEETTKEPEIETIEADPEPVEPAPEPTPAPVEHHDSASNSVFLPAILGGLIAAGIGFGVAYYLIPRADPNLNATVAANSSALETLQSEVEAVASAEPATVDLAPLTDQIASVEENIAGEIATISARIDAVDERLITLEKQPSSDGTLQESALQAYQRELDELRAQVEDQAGAAIAQLESTRAEAEAIEQAALDAARTAQIRAALAQLQVALNDGVPMGATLSDLEAALGEPVPAALAAVAEGAPTLAKLQADFPNAARSALSAARAGGESGEETTAFGAFLREQLNVRSTAPRDGDDADAILSRVQDAVSNGQLQTALDEIAGLPDAAKAPLSEWVAVAKTRVAAVDAADAISNSLNVN